MSSDDHLVELLRAIRDGDDADLPMDNTMLVARLGWSDTDVASSLGVAKDRLLIWGLRSGGNPPPYYAELELTVQGRRLVAAHDAAAG